MWAGQPPRPALQGRGLGAGADELDFWRQCSPARPSSQAVAGAAAGAPPQAARRPPVRRRRRTSGRGSNAYGLGREATDGGRGMLLGNPHYPWTGNRFYRMHFTIPGKLNVVGVGLVTCR